MARRKKSAYKLPMIVFSMLVSVVVAGGFVSSKLLDPHRTTARLNIEDYRESPVSYSGSNFVIEGKVFERLAQTQSGAVYALAIKDQHLAIVIPQAIQPNFNIEKGQVLLVDIRIAVDGSAIATAISKK